MKKYLVKKGFITQKIGNKISIFDGENSFLFTLNEVATKIFEKIKQGKTEKEIINFLTDMYGISYKKALEDVNEFISHLKKQQIINEVNK